MKELRTNFVVPAALIADGSLLLFDVKTDANGKVSVTENLVVTGRFSHYNAAIQIKVRLSPARNDDGTVAAFFDTNATQSQLGTSLYGTFHATIPSARLVRNNYSTISAEVIDNELFSPVAMPIQTKAA
jgi:hypothetical protein